MWGLVDSWRVFEHFRAAARGTRTVRPRRGGTILRCGGRSTGTVQQAFLRRAGVVPNRARNTRVRWAWSAKPQAAATSLMAIDP